MDQPQSSSNSQGAELLTPPPIPPTLPSQHIGDDQILPSQNTENLNKSFRPPAPDPNLALLGDWDITADPQRDIFNSSLYVSERTEDEDLDIANMSLQGIMELHLNTSKCSTVGSLAMDITGDSLSVEDSDLVAEGEIPGPGEDEVPAGNLVEPLEDVGQLEKTFVKEPTEENSDFSPEVNEIPNFEKCVQELSDGNSSSSGISFDSVEVSSNITGRVSGAESCSTSSTYLTPCGEGSTVQLLLLRANTPVDFGEADVMTGSVEKQQEVINTLEEAVNKIEELDIKEEGSSFHSSTPAKRKKKKLFPRPTPSAPPLEKDDPLLSSNLPPPGGPSHPSTLLKHEFQQFQALVNSKLDSLATKVSELKGTENVQELLAQSKQEIREEVESMLQTQTDNVNTWTNELSVAFTQQMVNQEEQMMRKLNALKERCKKEFSTVRSEMWEELTHIRVVVDQDLVGMKERIHNLSASNANKRAGGRQQQSSTVPAHPWGYSDRELESGMESFNRKLLNLLPYVQSVSDVEKGLVHTTVSNNANLQWAASPQQQKKSESQMLLPHELASPEMLHPRGTFLSQSGNMPGGGRGRCMQQNLSHPAPKEQGGCMQQILSHPAPKQEQRKFGGMSAKDWPLLSEIQVKKGDVGIMFGKKSGLDVKKQDRDVKGGQDMKGGGVKNGGPKYSREALLNLGHQPTAMTRPPGLEQSEVVLETPRDMAAIDYENLRPHFPYDSQFYNCNNK